MKKLKNTLPRECIVPYEPPKCEDDSYRIESIKQLKFNIFNPKALVHSDDFTKDRIKICRECLLAIEERGKDKNFGYGRNFYYTVWGYGKEGGPDSELMNQYRDIREKYRNIQHEFLCGVDYVSHSLKARFANGSEQLTQTGIDLELLMPWDFTEIIKPMAKKDAFCADCGMPINMKEKDMCIIGRDSILNLKKKQLETLHKSDEYQEFKACMQRCKTASQVELTESQKKMGRGKLQEAFDVYIQRIRRELNPKQHYTDKCLTVMRDHSDVLGEGLLLLTYIYFLPLAGVNGAKWLKNKQKSAISSLNFHST